MPGQPYKTNRYSMHDKSIDNAVSAFNKDKAKYSGASPDQAKSIPNLSADLVKAWLIQETGGGDARSLAAWKVDPGQVNVPGDWTPAKASLGLKEPKHRNEGTAEKNIMAAIGFLTRKGFSRSGSAPAPKATFGGWATALLRYNGRNVLTSNGKSYSENYSNQIMNRSKDMSKATPIDLPRPVSAHHPAAQHHAPAHHAPAHHTPAHHAPAHHVPAHHAPAHHTQPLHPIGHRKH